MSLFDGVRARLCDGGLPRGPAALPVAMPRQQDDQQRRVMIGTNVKELKVPRKAAIAKTLILPAFRSRPFVFLQFHSGDSHVR